MENEKTVNEYFGIALMLSDDEYSMCCVLQFGTGNTKETSKLVERWFPYSPMKNIVGDNIGNDFYVRPQQYFKVKITESIGFISYEFSKEEETSELLSLLKTPDYFEGFDDLDNSWMDTKD